MPYIPEPGTRIPPGGLGGLIQADYPAFELLAQTLERMRRRNPLPPPVPIPVNRHGPGKPEPGETRYGPQHPPGYRRPGYPWEGNIFVRDPWGYLVHPDAPPILGRKLRG